MINFCCGCEDDGDGDGSAFSRLLLRGGSFFRSVLGFALLFAEAFPLTFVVVAAAAAAVSSLTPPSPPPSSPPPSFLASTLLLVVVFAVDRVSVLANAQSGAVGVISWIVISIPLWLLGSPAKLRCAARLMASRPTEGGSVMMTAEGVNSALFTFQKRRKDFQSVRLVCFFGCVWMVLAL